MEASPRILLCLILCGCVASAQSPTDPAATVTALERRVAAYRHLLADWAGLTRYGSDDSEVRPPALEENRVVFLGDQITERWGGGSAPFFPGRPYFNRGISAQTTPQMLVRFRQDVIGLKPRVVVIQGGTNNIAGVTGPSTRATIGDDLTSMTELATANGIRVVLASITPVCDCVTDQTSQRSPVRIADVNGWIRDYSARTGSVYLDYYSALADGGSFKRELTIDGLLPNDAGYTVMASLAEEAIARALEKR